MAGRLDDHAILASRIGADDLGSLILSEIVELPVDPSFIQKDCELPTGTVTVEVNPEGQPAYCIHENVAWDAFELTPQWQNLATEADAVCFGTLAQRSRASRTTIQAFISSTRKNCLRVFDMNLRHPFFSEDIIRWSLNHSSLLKVNEDELKVVFKLLDLSIPSGGEMWRGAADTLMTRFPLKMVCLTLGSEGSLIVTGSGYYRHPGIPTAVIDTVGAGDAFLATITHYALQGTSLKEMSIAANRNGAWVASQAAAIPSLPISYATNA
jgi:fructokinase